MDFFIKLASKVKSSSFTSTGTGIAPRLVTANQVAMNVNDFDAIGEFSTANNIDIVVVGPEDPLVNGIHDYFLANEALQGIHVIGPQKEAAALEGSKEFAT